MLSVTDLSQKESFPGSEFKPASIWTCWMLIDRQMQSAFMPELHRWISKLTARHLQGPPGDLLITMVKETVILYKKEFRKMKKSRISHWSERDETRNDCKIACDCVKRASVVLHVDLCKEIFARKHTATHKPTSAQPTHSATMTHTHTYTHTPINRLWSPLAYGQGGNNMVLLFCLGFRELKIILPENFAWTIFNQHSFNLTFSCLTFSTLRILYKKNLQVSQKP